MKIVIVKNFIDADRLIKDGYKCVGIDRNKDNKKELVFFFRDTGDIQEKLIYYKNHKRYIKNN